MIKIYKNKEGQVMYLDDTHLETAKLVIERLATDDDATAKLAEYAMFVASTAPAPASSRAATSKRRTTVRSDGAA